jgi:phosphate starvation-inducible protein PhoH
MDDFHLFHRSHIMRAIPTRDAGVIDAGEFLLFLPSAVSASLHTAQKNSCLRPKKREDCTQLDF